MNFMQPSLFMTKCVCPYFLGKINVQTLLFVTELNRIKQGFAVAGGKSLIYFKVKSQGHHRSYLHIVDYIQTKHPFMWGDHNDDTC